MRYEFEDMELEWINSSYVIYTGCSDIQHSFSSASHDPRKILKIGETYHVKDANVYSSSTTLELVEFPGMTFNSVCFDIEGEHDK